jgi:hypothetical protein
LDVLPADALIELCKTAVELLNEHVLLCELEVEGFNYLVVDWEGLWGPSSLEHGNDFVSFLELLQ